MQKKKRRAIFHYICFVWLLSVTFEQEVGRMLWELRFSQMAEYVKMIISNAAAAERNKPTEIMMLRRRGEAEK